MGYLANFVVYLMAMTGLIGLSVVVFKFVNCKGVNKTANGSLKILESMSLGARKTLYIVEANSEKFLIASDAERTSLISKLENVDSCALNVPDSHTKTRSGININKINYADRTVCGITGVNSSPYSSSVQNRHEMIVK